MRELKENDGLGFQSFGNFNIALLAKQGWHLIQQPDSLLAKVMKAKYYPILDFLHSNLKHGLSYAWRSIWVARKVLDDGLSRCVIDGASISIFNHKLTGNNLFQLTMIVNNAHLEVVVDLKEAESK